MDSKYPVLTNQYESANIPGLYFAGTLSHGRDYKRCSGSGIAGFRHTARVLARILKGRSLKGGLTGWPCKFCQKPWYFYPVYGCGLMLCSLVNLCRLSTEWAIIAVDLGPTLTACNICLIVFLLPTAPLRFGEVGSWDGSDVGHGVGEGQSWPRRDQEPAEALNFPALIEHTFRRINSMAGPYHMVRGRTRTSLV